MLGPDRVWPVPDIAQSYATVHSNLRAAMSVVYTPDQVHCLATCMYEKPCCYDVGTAPEVLQSEQDWPFLELLGTPGAPNAECGSCGFSIDNPFEYLPACSPTGQSCCSDSACGTTYSVVVDAEDHVTVSYCFTDNVPLYMEISYSDGSWRKYTMTDWTFGIENYAIFDVPSSCHCDS